MVSLGDVARARFVPPRWADPHDQHRRHPSDSRQCVPPDVASGLDCLERAWPSGVLTRGGSGVSCARWVEPDRGDDGARRPGADRRPVRGELRTRRCRDHGAVRRRGVVVVEPFPEGKVMGGVELASRLVPGTPRRTSPITGSRSTPSGTSTTASSSPSASAARTLPVRRSWPTCARSSRSPAAASRAGRSTSTASSTRRSIPDHGASAAPEATGPSTRPRNTVERRSSATDRAVR